MYLCMPLFIPIYIYSEVYQVVGFKFFKKKKIIETETIYIAYFFVHSRAVASYLALSVL